MRWTAINRLGRRGAACAWALTAAVSGLLCACAATGPAPPKDVLDESSGTRLIIVERPLVFARSRIDVAANVRDYLTLVAAEEDRSGKYQAWLIAHRWSTVDPRMQGDSDAGQSQLHIFADDRELTLQRAEPAPAVLARGDLLFAPKGSGGRSAAYQVDDATLRFIATSTRLLLRLGEGTALPAYVVWDDGRAAVQALLSEVGSP